MDLTAIVPPPDHPVYNGRPEDWEIIERILEMQLPMDYKTLIHTYGTGCFLEFIYPLSPFAPFHTAINLLSGGTRQLLSAYRSGQEEFPQYSPPFAAYPEKEGLFPWATTVNGDTLFWLRQGSPDNWPIVICDSKFTEEYDRYNSTATKFLCDLFSGKITPTVFPALTMPHRFTPYDKG